MKEKIFCGYHPTRPAHWHCSRCASSFCGSCITKRAKGQHLADEYLYLCPKCYRPAEQFGVANIIDPFWTRLHKLFIYPLALNPLILITVLALLGTFFAEPGLIDWIVRFAISAVMVKYSFEALRLTASGDLRAPKIGSRVLTDNIRVVLKQLGLFLIMVFAAAWVNVNMGDVAAILFVIFLLLCLPAMLILLASTESLLAAINPNIFVRMIFRIGWGYLLMYFFLLLILGAPTAVAGYIEPRMPPAIHFFLKELAMGYYTIIAYHLMGYVILQYHEEIGYEVDYETFRDPGVKTAEVEESADEATLKEVNLMIQDGKLDEAISAIRSHVETLGGITDLTLSERYFKLLKMKKRGRELMAHCEPHLELLVREGRKVEACKLYLSILSKKPAFTPGARTLFSLGGWLNESGKSKQAVAALGRLGKEHPDNPLAPKAYFRAAQIVNDRYMNPERAGKMLRALLDKYPDHEIAPKVRNYLAYIGAKE